MFLVSPRLVGHAVYSVEVRLLLKVVNFQPAVTTKLHMVDNATSITEDAYIQHMLARINGYPIDSDGSTETLDLYQSIGTGDEIVNSGFRNAFLKLTGEFGTE